MERRLERQANTDLEAGGGDLAGLQSAHTAGKTKKTSVWRDSKRIRWNKNYKRLNPSVK
jgi:hypothetical protein